MINNYEERPRSKLNGIRGGGSRLGAGTLFGRGLLATLGGLGGRLLGRLAPLLGRLVLFFFLGLDVVLVLGHSGLVFRLGQQNLDEQDSMSSRMSGN
jgi:hypothetical protein